MIGAQGIDRDVDLFSFATDASYPLFRPKPDNGPRDIGRLSFNRF
jgi:hypothetical protein